MIVHRSIEEIAFGYSNHDENSQESGSRPYDHSFLNRRQRAISAIGSC
jgi:hypothetical protein